MAYIFHNNQSFVKLCSLNIPQYQVILVSMHKTKQTLRVELFQLQ